MIATRSALLANMTDEELLSYTDYHESSLSTLGYELYLRLVETLHPTTELVTDITYA